MGYTCTASVLYMYPAQQTFKKNIINLLQNGCYKDLLEGIPTLHQLPNVVFKSFPQKHRMKESVRPSNCWWTLEMVAKKVPQMPAVQVEGKHVFSTLQGELFSSVFFLP